MNNELKDLLRSVLQEELQPINHRLDKLDQRVGGLEQSHADMKTMLAANQEAIEKTHAELVSFRKETNEKFDHLERQNQFFDNDLNELTKRVSVQEREIKKLKYEMG
jgi:chromosome segregation ATPase